jgi:hypothetical protein
VRLIAEFASGDRFVARLQFGDERRIAGKEKVIHVGFISWDHLCVRWLYAENLLGQWYWYDDTKNVLEPIPVR